MINTIADLLEEIREKEGAALAAHKIDHPVVIGSMYEGLTRHLLNLSLFKGLDLRVVTGHVSLPNGTLSRQIDVMLVIGDGHKTPYIDHFIYPFAQVVAVVEVKKSLYSGELSDAFENLESLRHEDLLTSVPSTEFLSAFRMISQIEFPVADGIGSLPAALASMALNIAYDVALPARIVFGYEGFRTEKTLRDGLIKHLEERLKSGATPSLGPSNFPSLVVCGDNALVKLNAMPYAAHTENSDEWLLIASARNVGVRALLEVIWTRLSARGLVDSRVFGADLDDEHLCPLLFAKTVERDGNLGWGYRYTKFSAKTLKNLPSMVEWEPVFLSSTEATLMNYLCIAGSVDTNSDSFWADYSAEMEEGLPASLDYLRRHGLALLGLDGILRLLTHKCRVGVSPPHGWVAGEDETGRFTRWMLAQQAKKSRSS
ncbi:DUF6602 domain-containing protein [Gemmatimonas sp.]|uniref:DUF6602 domain-containing protein n=1 Tax=Gemmatimonas sp. TaxID=1962908 RepID=UPI0022C9DF6C|nr:DUF6602 domain-containing protein [Gemmatimonas sp.]MCZ8206532.1 hypothetical protein [Gemmatimonas sp.]